MLRLPVFGLLLSLMIVPAGLATAQAQPAPDAWQMVITEQIEALRHGDAATALRLSDSRLRRVFSRPSQFVTAIKAWGYEAIINSHAHSFGSYHMASPREVEQDVKFVGPDQSLYEAHFLVGLEGGVWRVHRVTPVVRMPGIGA
jgi:hypothetical protein